MDMPLTSDPADVHYLGSLIDPPSLSKTPCSVPFIMDHDHEMTDDASLAGTINGVSRVPSPKLDWKEHQTGRVIITSGVGTNGEHRGEPEEQTSEAEQQRQSRYRPRTFPYQRYLPYEHKDKWEENLEECIRELYIAISAGDFVPGATHWTREMRGLLQLKFDIPRELRVKLAKLYYELALAPGLENGAVERFASMFMTLTK
jgi:hypothetical protein